MARPFVLTTLLVLALAVPAGAVGEAAAECAADPVFLHTP